MSKKEMVAKRLSETMNEERENINASILNKDWDSVKSYLFKSFSTAKALRKILNGEVAQLA